MRDRFTVKQDRQMLDLLKNGGNPLSAQFGTLMDGNDARGARFRGILAELHRALVNANIAYQVDTSKFVSLSCCIIDWNNGKPKFESVLKEGTSQQKLEIDDGLWVDNDPDRLFAAFMEIVYQVRSTLFHGNLPPTSENERVIRQLYLSLSMVMERV